jgi:transglutaminase-like putative cysteine protease
LGVELENSSVPAGAWTANASVELSWTDLDHGGVSYRVERGQSEVVDGSTVVVTTSEPGVSVPLPSDGLWWVHVVPVAGSSNGPVSSFGPFGRDSSAPPVPVIAQRLDPPGYTFDLAWSAVEDPESGVVGYELSRRAGSGDWDVVAFVAGTSYVEDNLGNGAYEYRVRAVNAAGSPSAWSGPLRVEVEAPMQNPGVGSRDFGVHANYTSFLHVWDLSDPGRYYTLSDVQGSPHAAVRSSYLGPEWGIETENATLQGIVDSVVGDEQNTFLIAQELFLYLFEETDYDSSKAAGPNQDLLRAGATLDVGAGICGDLAVLYITLLRIAGVPARPVHGYLDNPSAGVGDFHMWVEAYVGGQADYPWMTVDVSGASWDTQNPDEPLEDALYLYFGIFNAEYLSLGTELVYDEPEAERASWNAWARFAWTQVQGSSSPKFEAEGTPADVVVVSSRMYVNTVTRERVVADASADPQDVIQQEGWTCGQGQCFSVDVKSTATKRIDYGVDVTQVPSGLRSLTVELRYPVADEYAATNPYQSVIYTVYSNRPAGAFEKDEASGFVVFEESF